MGLLGILGLILLIWGIVVGSLLLIILGVVLLLFGGGWVGYGYTHRRY